MRIKLHPLLERLSSWLIQFIIIVIILFQFPFLLAAVYTWEIRTQRYGNVVTTLSRLSSPCSSN